MAPRQGMPFWRPPLSVHWKPSRVVCAEVVAMTDLIVWGSEKGRNKAREEYEWNCDDGWWGEPSKLSTSYILHGMTIFPVRLFLYLLPTSLSVSRRSTSYLISEVRSRSARQHLDCGGRLFATMSPDAANKARKTSQSREQGCGKITEIAFGWPYSWSPVANQVQGARGVQSIARLFPILWLNDMLGLDLHSPIQLIKWELACNKKPLKCRVPEISCLGQVEKR